MRAFADVGIEPPEDGFDGPTAIGATSEDVPAMLKAIVDLTKETEVFKVRGAIVDGLQMSVEDVRRYADLPTMPVLQAQLLSVFNSPATQLASVFAGTLRQFMNVLKAYYISGEYSIMADLKKIKTELNKLTILEVAELVKELEEEWGVSAAAPVAIAAAPGMAAAGGEAVEEKSEYDVILKDVGPKKIDVIKAIRQITQMGLADSKELAETAGAKVMEQTGKDAANDAKAKLEAAGATVELV
jgi:large subunit ribosomal protein L7/L12